MYKTLLFILHTASLSNNQTADCNIHTKARFTGKKKNKLTNEQNSPVRMQHLSKD